MSRVLPWSIDDGRMGNKGQVGYPSDVTDEEWAFVAPYLALCREDAEQREYSLRAVFNGLRYIVRTGGQWRYLPNDLPPWTVVYQQTQRWIRARVSRSWSRICACCCASSPDARRSRRR